MAGAWPTAAPVASETSDSAEANSKWENLIMRNTFYDVPVVFRAAAL
jgi:hypothetical protein